MMSQFITYICDKCRREVENQGHLPRLWVEITIQGAEEWVERQDHTGVRKVSVDRRLQLCEQCTRPVLELLDKKEAE